jgi:hypothetical protein
MLIFSGSSLLSCVCTINHLLQEAMTVLQQPSLQWNSESRLRCVRRGIARLVIEDGMAVRTSISKLQI